MFWAPGVCYFIYLFDSSLPIDFLQVIYLYDDDNDSVIWAGSRCSRCDASRVLGGMLSLFFNRDDHRYSTQLPQQEGLETCTLFYLFIWFTDNLQVIHLYRKHGDDNDSVMSWQQGMRLEPYVVCYCFLIGVYTMTSTTAAIALNYHNKRGLRCTGIFLCATNYLQIDYLYAKWSDHCLAAQHMV